MMLENTREAVWNQLRVRDWDLEEIRHYLKGSGYDGDDISSVEFIKINQFGCAIFKTKCPDHYTEDGSIEGFVFLSIEKGRIVADF